MNRKPFAIAGVALSLATLLVPVTAPAQGVYVYPAGGQSQQQQQADSGECHIWAVNQSGFNPSGPRTAVAQQPYSPPPPKKESGLFGRGSYGEGGGITDAGIGAAGGALVGAIAGNAGAGAAIGALSGLFIGGVKRSSAEEERAAWERQQAQQQRQAQEAAAQQDARGNAEYQRAFATCMRGRNYTVD